MYILYLLLFILVRLISISIDDSISISIHLFNLIYSPCELFFATPVTTLGKAW